MTSRNKFALTHLVSCLLIAALIAAFVLLYWYPTPLNKATGVTHIFLMMLGIDLVLGPLLTWLVYKDGKKTLIFDLTVIIVIQIAALCYGIYNIGQGRPTWIVYSVDRFDLVRYNEIYDKNVNRAQPQFQHPSWLKPQFVAIQFAKNDAERKQDMLEEVLGGVAISQRPERYVELTQVKRQIQKKAQNLKDLQLYNSKDAVNNILSKYPTANAWVPLKAIAEDMVVLLNKETATVVAIVDLRPWK